jgi:hypothetical protein
MDLDLSITRICERLVLEVARDGDHVEGEMLIFSRARRSEIHPGSSTARLSALGRFTR